MNPVNAMFIYYAFLQRSAQPSNLSVALFINEEPFSDFCEKRRQNNKNTF